ncbi:hypothetical protein C8R46DRAFT_1067592 [Mycena filopes]|nr:hypothetical protein C8R46DRAFT_1067592 [Mycena filopes]
MRGSEIWIVFAYCTWFFTVPGVHGYARRATTSSSAKTPAASPGFNFNPMSDLTNCTPATFSWFYGSETASQPGDLILIITSDIVGDADLDQVITPVTLDPLARSYTWPSVNATPGGYQLEAKSDLASFLILSDAFKIKPGSCHSASASLTAQGATKTSASIPPVVSVVANPDLNFNQTADMKNCTPAVINWFYYKTTDPQPNDLTLTISSDIPGDKQFNRRITTTPIDPSARSFTWPSVNQIPGVFQILAQSDLMGWSVLSGPFNVTTNTGPCPALAASSTSQQSVSRTDAPTTTTVADTPADGTKGKKGAIAGGVVGGLCGVVVVAAIVFRVIRRSYRVRQSPPSEDTQQISPFPVVPRDGTTVLVQGDGKTTLTWDPPAVDKSLAGSGKRRRAAETALSEAQEEEVGAETDGGQSSLQAPVENPSEGALAAPETGPLAEQQLRAIAQRVAAMEVQLQVQGQLGEQPPGYDAELAPVRT